MILVTAIIFAAIVIAVVNIVLTYISAFQHQNLRAGVVGYFLCLGIILIEHFIEYSGYSRAFPFSIFISAAFYLLLIPFLNVIINSIFSSPIEWKRFLIEAIPAFGFLILMIPFYMYSGEVKYRYLTNFISENRPGSYKHLVLIGILLFQTLIYAPIWYRKMNNYALNAKSKASLADLEFIPWISRLLVVIIAFTSSILITWLVRIFSHGNYYTLDQLGNIVLSIIPYAFLFLLFFLPEKPFPNIVTNSNSENREKEFDPLLLDQLQKLMEHEKLYLNAEISLSEVADFMGISRHDLSNLLNQGFQKSFYDFVNEYRITHAIKLIDSEMIKTFSLSGIARESGFNNYVSFYRVFRRLKGLTPSAYIKK